MLVCINEARPKSSEKAAAACKRNKGPVACSATMIYYNPLSFYALIFAVRGSVLPSCALHAFIFAGVGAGAAYLVERDLLSHDFTSISLLTGLVMSLLLTFRLTFSFNRYAEAVATIAGLQGLCTQLVAKVCGSLDARSPVCCACGVG